MDRTNRQIIKKRNTHDQKIKDSKKKPRPKYRTQQRGDCKNKARCSLVLCQEDLWHNLIRKCLYYYFQRIRRKLFCCYLNRLRPFNEELPGFEQKFCVVEGEPQIVKAGRSAKNKKRKAKQKEHTKELRSKGEYKRYVDHVNLFMLKEKDNGSFHC